MNTCTTIPVDALDYRGFNAPLHRYEHMSSFQVPAAEGASRHQFPVEGLPFDSLLVNKQSPTLVVSFNSGFDQVKYEPPRFERLGSLNDLPVSVLYLTDPNLHVSNDLQLTWFVGTEKVDLIELSTQFVCEVARQLGVERIVLTGFSAGGFAALQVSRRIKDSLAVPFDAQSDITLDQGFYPKFHRAYLARIWPHLWDGDEESFSNAAKVWKDLLGTRTSAVASYEQGFDNFVYYCQNINDHFHIEYCLPFKAGADASDRKDAVVYSLYDGEHRHWALANDKYIEFMTDALRFADSLPKTQH